LFCQNDLRDIHGDKPIVQVSYSLTIKKGTVRGMHFQYPPKSKTKLVRCLQGSVFDVIVDIRNSSPTFLQWHGEILSEENMKKLYVPQGFAHGFQTLQENCRLLYLHDEYYDLSHEGGLRYSDPRIGINRPLEITVTSEKDRNYPLLKPEFSGVAL